MRSGCGKAPQTNGKIGDVDGYIVPKTGNEVRIRGDDQGPITTLNVDGTQSRSGRVGAFGRKSIRSWASHMYLIFVCLELQCEVYNNLNP